jgi:hypothetical protein
MSALTALPPDQRAVVELLVAQRRTPGEIGELVGMSAEAVRGRAERAVAALAPDEPALAEVVERRLEQAAPPRPVAEEPPTPERAPPTPQDAPPTPQDPPPTPQDAPPTPEHAPPPREEELTPDEQAPARPAAEEPRRASSAPPRPGPFPAPAGALRPGVPAPARRSRLLPAALLLAGLLAAVAAVVVLTRDDGDREPDRATRAADRGVELRPSTVGGEASGSAAIVAHGGRRALALLGSGLAPTSERSAYGVWLAGGARAPAFAGYAPRVGGDRRLSVFGVLGAELDPTTHDELLVTRERVTAADQGTPSRPGQVVLRGAL